MRTGYRYSFLDPRTADGKEELISAICAEEGYEFDGYCRDHEEDFEEGDPKHDDCDAYRAMVRVLKFSVPGGPPGESDWLVLRHDEVLDRNGYCALHSGAAEALGGDTPNDCANPHDHCVHGTYVGGCGIDWMCGACEADEED